jgi:hypothetical protein
MKLKLVRSGIPRIVAMALVAVVVAAVGSVAQARDVHWSVGIQAAPGVTVGVGNSYGYHYAPPVYYAPPPVYYAPAPVYLAPAPVYYVRPAPVYGPVRYYVGPPQKKWKSKRKHWN